jgi:hypothetical protein
MAEVLETQLKLIADQVGPEGEGEGFPSRPTQGLCLLPPT